jgi:iron complex transport system ATP-binding protein
MQEDLLSRVYDCDLRVRKDPYTGLPAVTGVLDTVLKRPPVQMRLHVIAGGGSGIELFRRLLIEGFEVTSGVLNLLDSDAEAARALGIECSLEQPFSAVGAESGERARRMVREADGVILSKVPFGSGNLVNLDLAIEAARMGKPVWVASGIDERDYTPGRKAVEKSVTLKSQGAREWETMQELMAHLKGPLMQQQKNG